MAEENSSESLTELESEPLHSSNKDISFGQEFIDQPPKRSQCPICLLVVRDPQQTPCCGNAFCKTCICTIEENNQPCPSCKTEDFHYFPDKGLQQELYSSRVYCTKRSLGCDWQGDLGELGKHLDGDGKDPANLEGCQFVTVNCSFCSESYPRGELEEHQTKCRPVDCPNKCGQLMQHQKLEEHLSSECELSEMECEFSHAGCEAQMPRKDLPSHMTDNMAPHMSLLAKENRQLKAELIKVRQSISMEKRLMSESFSRLPPFHISYPWKKYAFWSGVFCYITDESVWNSEPFYSHCGGHKLRMKIWCTCSKKPVANAVKGVFLTYEFIESKFEVEPTLFILTSVLDPESGSHNVQKNLKVTHTTSESLKISNININKCLKHESMEVCVERITVLSIPQVCSVSS